MNPSSPNTRSRRLVTLVGLALGGLLAAIAAGSWGVTAGSGSAGADVSALANLTGELNVSPAGKTFLRGRALMPGDGVTGTLQVRNQTAKALDVRARLAADRPDLNRVLHASLDADGVRLYDGPLVGLRRFSRETVRMPAGQTVDFKLRLSLPNHAKGGYEARTAETTLALDSKVAR
jgi:hypothetical protein